MYLAPMDHPATPIFTLLLLSRLSMYDFRPTLGAVLKKKVMSLEKQDMQI